MSQPEIIDASLLETPVSRLSLTPAALGALKRGNITSIEELIRLTEPQVLELRDVGTTTLDMIKAQLAAYDPPLALAPELELDPHDVTKSELLALGLTKRAYNLLLREGIETVGHLTQYTERDLLRLHNLKASSLDDIKKKLGAVGLSLKPED